jgi:hypothetical protein
MGLHSWTAKTERAAMSTAQALRLVLCVLGVAALLTALFGGAPWPLRLAGAVIVGGVLSVLAEILWLIRKDEHRARKRPP